MIEIIATNTICRIDGLRDMNLAQALDMECSYDVSGALFSDRMQKGYWDGRKHLFSKITGSFPTGLLNRVKRLLESYNVQYTVNDQRVPITLGKEIPSTVKPWEWQEDVIGDCINKHSGIVKLPTGSGKSVVFINLMARLNLNTVILVNSRDLLYQIKKDIKNCLNIDAGQVGDGVIQVSKVTCAMVQTVANAYKIKLSKIEEKDKTNMSAQNVLAIQNMIKDTQCLIVDEVHVSGVAPTYYAMNKLWMDAYYKFGFSATPYRTDKADLLLEAAFGERIVDKSCTELIEKGYLSKPTFYLVNFKHNRADKDMSYAEIYDREVVNNEDRNFVITKAVSKFWKRGKSILIIVQHIKHGKLLEEMLGMVVGKSNVKFVQGSTDTDLRRKTVTDLNSGKVRIVIATKIFAVGMNFPELNVLVNTKAQISPVDYTQCLGRALRKTATKDTVVIIDIMDYGCRYLTTHSEERLEILKTEPAFVLNEIESSKI
jgi:superfamily II DNA or RNA helicase